MSLDLAALLRRYKPERWTGALRPRPAEDLPEAEPGAAKMVLLDTTALIHGLAGRLPPGAAALVRSARQFHCSVCLCELAVGLAHRDQAAPGTAAVRSGYAQLMGALSRNRILSPSAELWAAAGLVAGILARTQTYQQHQSKEMLHDALVYLTAAKQGIPVLTENRADFDLIQQVAGHGRFLWYTAT